MNEKFFYLDTEFHEDGRIIDLISIGVVSEEGKEFYRISTEFSPNNCNLFVREKVLPQLGGGVWKNKKQIAADLVKFLKIREDDQDIQFVGYYADYDHVVLAQLFGRMVDMPSNINYFTLDIKQEAVMNDIDLSKIPNEDEHNALADARWNKRAWEYIQKVKKSQRK
jgi:hypothetical protein